MAAIKKSSTNCENWQSYIVPCDLTYAATKISGRWTLSVLNRLEDKKLRFSQLRDSIPGITERMLILQLKDLEKGLMIKRTVYNEAPPRVEYELTDIAREMIPIWRQLEKWGAKHRDLLRNIEE
jgi:DNA-binding HxlR family transcriptional regulator